MYDILEELCNNKGITITKLCVQVTGSSGNLSTWKKGYMRSDYLKKAAEILGVSTDYILGRSSGNGTIGNVTGANTTIQNSNINIAPPADNYFGNAAVSKAYEGLTEREKLSVQMFILDTAAASEKSNATVVEIKK